MKTAARGRHVQEPFDEPVARHSGRPAARLSAQFGLPRGGDLMKVQVITDGSESGRATWASLIGAESRVNEFGKVLDR